MQLLNQKSLKILSNLTHKLILLLMIILSALIFLLPWLIKSILLIDIGSGYKPVLAHPAYYVYFICILYALDILGLFILNHLRLLFKSCLLEDVFNETNVRRLFKMAVEAGLVTLILATKIFVVNSFMTMLVVFVFFMATVFCLVLTLLFAEAVNYKTENDLTI